jgi:hypothetical protein
VTFLHLDPKLSVNEILMTHVVYKGNNRILRKKPVQLCT